ncbi:uncharacterized protein VTP21DRAFT_3974 [Calcarisporiella thermophila]|uniref:uncharacterized protein n=1 Tax=Calcarisporiella thermophila TaxID=911321 RepID=UPI0037431658
MMPHRIIIRTQRNERLFGILESRPASGFTIDKISGKKKLIIICHGVFGHKNYLFQRLLAENLPIDNFRFDFRGNGESDGMTRYSNIDDDVEDLKDIVKYFRQRGYFIYALVGHSRGSIACMKYTCLFERSIPIMVNIAGRYHMAAIWSYINSISNFKEELKTRGYYNQVYFSRGQWISRQVSRENIEQYAKWDNSYLLDFPQTTSVLTCHGMKDKRVSVTDAHSYANIIPNHKIYLFDGAGHNFTGYSKQLVDVIISYFTDYNQCKFATNENLHPRKTLGGKRCKL